MSDFQYETLAIGSQLTRLLILEPGSPISDIRCRLKIDSLAASPKYEALSYCWGDPGDKVCISVQGSSMAITKNLENALRYLRLPEKPRVLWVDAICINQSDPLEKQDQVKLVSKIYRGASRVVAWTGTADADSEVALQIIEAFGKFVMEHEKELLERVDRAKINHDPGETSAQAIDRLGFPFSTQNWSALWRFLKRPYWTRAWVIQELAARSWSKDDSTIIVCGQERVDKRYLDWCCGMILVIIAVGNSTRLHSDEFDEPLRSMLRQGHPPGLSMMQIVSACCPTNGGKRSLEWLVQAAKRFNTYDPRDKIFALLGLASDADQQFAPDYTRDRARVLANFVKFSVEKNKDLRVLLGNRPLPKVNGVSWIPDLNGETPGDTVLSGMSDSTPYKAGGRIAMRASFHSNDTILKCRGVVLGQIETVIGPLTVQESAAESGIADSPGYITALRQLSLFDRSLKEPDTQEVFWRTLVMDASRVGIKPVYPAPAEFGLMKNVLFRGASTPETFRPDLREQRIVRNLMYATPFMSSIQKAMGNRCFFATGSGRMGVGPFGTRTGDMAVILYGCDLCLVLRPAGGRYHLIGDSYVHGVMNGEAVVQGNPNSVVDFELN